MLLHRLHCLTAIDIAHYIRAYSNNNSVLCTYIHPTTRRHLRHKLMLLYLLLRLLVLHRLHLSINDSYLRPLNITHLRYHLPDIARAIRLHSILHCHYLVLISDVQRNVCLLLQDNGTRALRALLCLTTRIDNDNSDLLRLVTTQNRLYLRLLSDLLQTITLRLIRLHL